MTIRELRDLVLDAKIAAEESVNELNESTNPQVRKLALAIGSRVEALEEVLQAIGGNPVLLKISGETHE